MNKLFETHRHSTDPEIISFQNMRKMIGYLALLLPLMTTMSYMIWGTSSFVMLGSISEYYYTILRDVFVGTLCMIALFLYAYKGYTEWEDRIFNFAAVLCLLIALFAMSASDQCPHPYSTTAIPGCTPVVAFSDSSCYRSNDFNIVFADKLMFRHRSYFGKIHNVSAGVLFILLGIVSLVLFTQSHGHKSLRGQKDLPRKKRQRNIVYITCGTVIFSVLILYAVYIVISERWPKNPFIESLRCYPVLLCVEWICLWSFGISWLVKGDGIARLNDAPERDTNPQTPRTDNV